MYAEFAAVVQSFNQLTSLLQSAHSLSNYNELVAAVSEVSSKLMAAQSVALGSQEKQASLASEVAELKDELRKFERFEREAGRYELHKLQSGGLVFAMKKGMENGQPEHYLCVTCIEKRQITRLQPDGEVFLACPLKHARVQIKDPGLPWSGQPRTDWV